MKASELERIVADHIRSDKEFQDKITRVLFGSEEEKEIGIVEMIKTMYAFFTTSKNVKTWIIGIAVVGVAITTIKGWWFSFPAFLISLLNK